MTAPPRLLVVEDDAAARDSLVRMFAAAGYAVRGYASAEALLAEGHVAGAGCVLADLRLGAGMSGIDLLRALRAAGLLVPVVLLSAHGDVQVAVRAMREGATDFIEKPAAPAALLAAVAAALARPPGAAADVQQRLARLSPREREVLRALVAGRSNKEVGLALGISPRTVETYRAAIMAKLGFGSFAEMVRFGLAAGVIE